MLSGIMKSRRPKKRLVKVHNIINSTIEKRTVSGKNLRRCVCVFFYGGGRKRQQEILLPFGI